MKLINYFPTSWQPYILHTRPRALPIVVAHMSVGFLLANGLSLTKIGIGQWLLAMLAWGVLLNGGTLAINSAFDHDEGDIGYLENPPPVPRYLAWFALILMLIGFLPAWILGWRFTVAYVIFFTMSILYSVPPFRCKARAGLDILINITGYGGLTLYAGWAATGRPIEPPITNIFLTFLFLFVCFYPLTQIYQMGEDSGRGDYTLALALGKQNALRLSITGAIIAFIFLFVEIFQRYWTPLSIIFVLPLLAWVFLLAHWYRHFRQVDMHYEQRGFYNALYAWALTDIMVVIAMI
jgi:4-hydroxybenzoate polyprenyltransferase